MKSIFTFFFLSLSYLMTAQNFEALSLPTDTFLNNSGADGFFLVNDVIFPNDYNEEWGSWSGWAISTMTDTETPGYTNQFSSISGTGADGSATYAVTFAFSPIPLYLNDLAGYGIQEIVVNNSTYGYLSMRDGDTAAKNFGGETGDDPDYFLLTIKGYLDGEYQDSIDFYLADYRFDDNSMDYIVDEWTTVNIGNTMSADSLEFSLSSSDIGMFGMNTPAYFCIDNITVDLLSSTTATELAGLSIKNTLVNDYLWIQSDLQDAPYQIVNVNGQIIQSGRLINGENQLDTRNFATGMNWIQVVDNGEVWVRKFVKKD